MRAFSSFLIAAFFTFSATAASIQKRAVSASVQLCIDDIAFVNVQTDVYKDRVDQYNSSQGWAGVANIVGKRRELETRLNQTIIDCCVTSPSIFTIEETDTVLSAADVYASKFIGTFDSLIFKRPEFDPVALSNLLIGNEQIKTFSIRTQSLNTCLRAKIPANPPNYLQTADGYFTQLKDKFVIARNTYPILPSSTS